MIVHFKLVVCVLFFMIKVQFTIGSLHFPGDLFGDVLVEDGIKGFVEKIFTFDDHKHQQKPQITEPSKHHFDKEIRISIKEDRAELDQIFGEKALPLLVEKLKIGEEKLDEALLAKLLLNKGSALKGIADGAIGAGELAKLLGKGGELVGDTVAAKEAAGSALLFHILPLLTGNIDFHLDHHLWELIKGFSAAEAAKALTFLLAHGKKDLIGLGHAELAKTLPLILTKNKIDNDLIALDEFLWDLLKHLEAAEAAKIIPLLHAKSEVAKNLAVKTGNKLVGNVELAKLLTLLLAKEKGAKIAGAELIGGIEFAKLVPLLKSVEAAEITKVLPAITKEKALAGAELAGGVEIAKLLPLLLASGVELAKLLPLHLAKEKALAAGEAKLLGGAELSSDIGLAKLLSLLATKEKAVEAVGGAADITGGVELAKLLSTLSAKEKAVEVGAGVGAGIAGLELAKLIPLILGKEALVEKSLFDAGTWATLKGLKAAEVCKVLPALLGAEKLKLLGLANGAIHLDDALWDIIKGLEVSEASKLLPLLLTKGKIVADTILPLILSKKALVTDSAIKIEEAEFAKLLALLVGREKIEHLHTKDFFNIDENIWRILKGLTKTELVSILPHLLGKETLELLGFAHGIIDIEDHIWDSIKVLEAAELGKLLPILIAKRFAHHDFGHAYHHHPKLLHTEPLVALEEEFDKFDLLKYHALNVPTDDLWYEYY